MICLQLKGWSVPEPASASPTENGYSQKKENEHHFSSTRELSIYKLSHRKGSPHTLSILHAENLQPPFIPGRLFSSLLCRSFPSLAHNSHHRRETEFRSAFTSCRISIQGLCKKVSTSQAEEKLCSEGGEGFNPRVKPRKISRASRPAELRRRIQWREGRAPSVWLALRVTCSPRRAPAGCGSEGKFSSGA